MDPLFIAGFVDSGVRAGIVVALLSGMFLLLTKPSWVYAPDGKPLPFGLGKNETVTPFFLIVLWSSLVAWVFYV